jgi:trk system potassium uptake protein TrkH
VPFELPFEWRASCSLLGTVVKYFSLTMLLPLLVAVVYGEDVWVFAVSLVIGVTAGLALERLEPDPDLGPREALLLVSLSWLAAAVVAAIPFVLAGQGTASTLANPVNALFEATSGVTTTGATVLGQIGLERHSHAVMLWRQLIQ